MYAHKIQPYPTPQQPTNALPQSSFQNESVNYNITNVDWDNLFVPIIPNIDIIDENQSFVHVSTPLCDKAELDVSEDISFTKKSAISTTALQKTRSSLPEMSDKDFKERVIRDLSIIKLKIKKMEEKNNQKCSDNSHDCEVDTLIVSGFPLSDEDGLKTIENKIVVDKSYKSNLMRALSRIRRRKVDEATKLILRRIFSNKLAMKYSWLGRKGKLIFSNLLLSKIILETVLKLISMSTEADIIVSGKNWLRHASKRHENSL